MADALDVADLIRLPVEKLGVHVLRRLLAMKRAGSPVVGDSRRGFIEAEINDSTRPRPTTHAVMYSLGEAARANPAAQRAYLEAWNWLERQGLIAPHIQQTPTGGHDGYFVTREGERVARLDDPLKHIAAERRLAVDLHSRLEARPVRSQFLLGAYESAALEAMKTVEVATREVAGLPADLTGGDLFTQAFRPTGSNKAAGPLADSALPPAEQEATMNLFRSAFGVFRNPPAHREVVFDDPTEAAEIVMLADLLLRILDRAAARIGKQL